MSATAGIDARGAIDASFDGRSDVLRGATDGRALARGAALARGGSDARGGAESRGSGSIDIRGGAIDAGNCDGIPEGNADGIPDGNAEGKPVGNCDGALDAGPNVGSRGGANDTAPNDGKRGAASDALGANDGMRGGPSVSGNIDGGGASVSALESQRARCGMAEGAGRNGERGPSRWVFTGVYEQRLPETRLKRRDVDCASERRTASRVKSWSLRAQGPLRRAVPQGNDVDRSLAFEPTISGGSCAYRRQGNRAGVQGPREITSNVSNTRSRHGA